MENTKLSSIDAGGIDKVRKDGSIFSDAGENSSANLKNNPALQSFFASFLPTATAQPGSPVMVFPGSPLLDNSRNNNAYADSGIETAALSSFPGAVAPGNDNPFTGGAGASSALNNSALSALQFPSVQNTEGASPSVMFNSPASAGIQSMPGTPAFSGSSISASFPNTGTNASVPGSSTISEPSLTLSGINSSGLPIGNSSLQNISSGTPAFGGSSFSLPVRNAENNESADIAPVLGMTSETPGVFSAGASPIHNAQTTGRSPVGNINAYSQNAATPAKAGAAFSYNGQSAPNIPEVNGSIHDAGPLTQAMQKPMSLYNGADGKPMFPAGNLKRNKTEGYIPPASVTGTNEPTGDVRGQASSGSGSAALSGVQNNPTAAFAGNQPSTDTLSFASPVGQNSGRTSKTSFTITCESKNGKKENDGSIAISDLANALKMFEQV